MRESFPSTVVSGLSELPAGQQSGRREQSEQRLVLLATSVSYIVVILDTSIVTVALDRIAANLSTDITGLQWLINIYTLSFACLLLTGGTLGDRWGSRRIYTCGLLLFTLASGLCSIAPNLGWLLAGRLLQGIGAALLVPCSLTLLTQVFPEPGERAKAIGLWATCGGVALAAGPLAGGVLVDTLGWRSIFLVNVPIGIVGLWLISSVSGGTQKAKDRRFDVAGQITVIVALGVLVASLIEGPSLGWNSPTILGAWAIAAVAFVAFLTAEHYSPQPMLPLSLLTERTFGGLASAVLLASMCFFGMIFVLCLYFPQIRGYSALETGLAFLPCTAAVPVGNLAYSWLVPKFGSRSMIIAGSILQVIGFAGIFLVDATTPYTVLCLPLVALGLGGGLRTPASATLMMGIVSKEYSGIASGVLNSARQIGAATGVAIFGSLIAGAEHFEAGMALALCTSIGLSVVAIITIIISVRGDQPGAFSSAALAEETANVEAKS